MFSAAETGMESEKAMFVRRSVDNTSNLGLLVPVAVKLISMLTVPSGTPTRNTNQKHHLYQLCLVAGKHRYYSSRGNNNNDIKPVVVKLKFMTLVKMASTGSR